MLIADVTVQKLYESSLPMHRYGREIGVSAYNVYRPIILFTITLTGDDVMCNCACSAAYTRTETTRNETYRLNCKNEQWRRTDLVRWGTKRRENNNTDTDDF